MIFLIDTNVSNDCCAVVARGIFSEIFLRVGDFGSPFLANLSVFIVARGFGSDMRL